MEKVLVTGGTGFVGAYVLDKLLALGIKVTILDNQVIDSLPPGVGFFLGDIRDREAMVEAVGAHAGVIHLAGVLGTQELVEQPRTAVEVNIQGSLNVFEAVRVHRKRAVYISVGNYWMNNPYAISKGIAERFALMYNKEFKTQIAIVRAVNIYGPGQKTSPVRKAVPSFILPALKGEDLVVFGSGNQIMDFIYAKDIAEILVRALVMDHGVYLSAIEAGMGRDTTVNELAQLIIDTVGSQSKIQHVAMRSGEEPESIVKANVETLKCLDFSPTNFTSLEEGLRETVAWYRSQANQ